MLFLLNPFSSWILLHIASNLTGVDGNGVVNPPPTKTTLLHDICVKYLYLLKVWRDGEIYDTNILMYHFSFGASLVAQRVNDPPAVQETWDWTSCVK